MIASPPLRTWESSRKLHDRVLVSHHGQIKIILHNIGTFPRIDVLQEALCKLPCLMEHAKKLQETQLYMQLHLTSAPWTLQFPPEIEKPSRVIAALPRHQLHIHLYRSLHLGGPCFESLPCDQLETRSTPICGILWHENLLLSSSVLSARASVLVPNFPGQFLCSCDWSVNNHFLFDLQQVTNIMIVCWHADSPTPTLKRCGTWADKPCNTQ